MNILCFGSINNDETFVVDHIVRTGETLSSTKHSLHAGGKGANQSMALAKAGARVIHAGKIGSDGQWIKDLMNSVGIDTSFVFVEPAQATGRAIIQVSESTSDNAIVLFGGCNHRITQHDIDAVFGSPLHEYKGSWLLIQNEINNGNAIMECAHSNGMLIAFNPAPMTNQLLQDFPMHLVNLLVVNETEASELFRLLFPDSRRVSFESLSAEALVQTMQSVAVSLCERFSDNLKGIIITLGGHGIVARFQVGPNQEWKEYRQLAYAPSRVIDTTAAGDTFIGFFMAYIQQHAKLTADYIFGHESIGSALQWAVVASGIACCRPGSMTSVPSHQEVVEHVSKLTLQRNEDS